MYGSSVVPVPRDEYLASSLSPFMVIGLKGFTPIMYQKPIPKSGRQMKITDRANIFEGSVHFIVSSFLYVSHIYYFYAKNKFQFISYSSKTIK